MKKLTHSLAAMPGAIARGMAAAPLSAGAFGAFLLVAVVVSVLGGYQLMHLMSGINNAYKLPQHGAAQLLVIEQDLDDAAFDFDQQIQEWKDMLLRVNNEERFNAHRKAFIDSSIEVQKALRKTRAEMQTVGLGTEEVEQLIAEHRSLVLRYVSAQGRLDVRRPESFRAADRQVMGIDRDFHREVATVKANVEFLAQQQLSGTVPGGQYLLLGVLGAFSLLFMAFAGFAFASGFLRHAPGAGEPSCT
jgi:hypothetical protein